MFKDTYIEDFIGTIETYRENIGKASPKILLTKVTYKDGTTFRDHVWVNHSNRFKHFQFGDRIYFSARVEEYSSTNGVKLGLKHIRNIKKI